MKPLLKSLHECGLSIGGERKAEFRQDYFETMPVVGIDKLIDQLLGESPDIHSADVTKEWNPPIPEYPFVEWARIADAFFGPDAESTDGEKDSYSTNSGRQRSSGALWDAPAVPSRKAI
jgi:hypothetical protein